MPIIVKDFVWRQTESTITIQVPLNGVHSSKADLFTSPLYVKATYDKYFFEALLRHPIVTDDSNCILTTSNITFELTKLEKRTWDELEIDIPKTEKLEYKQKLIAEEHEKMQTQHKEKRDRKSELKKVAVREQICMETRQRQAIEDIKSEEKQKALGDVDKWQNQLGTDGTKNKRTTEQKDAKELTLKARKPNRIIHRTEPPKVLPPPLPRQTATVEVAFTPREFPTPSRESQQEEENEWLKKQAEVRRSVGFVSEDLRPEEKNPQYLQSKGDEFLKAGNYLGAISAYSFGIKLRDKFADLYVGRSEAHFAIGMKIIDYIFELFKLLLIFRMFIFVRYHLINELLKYIANLHSLLKGTSY